MDEKNKQEKIGGAQEAKMIGEAKEEKKLEAEKEVKAIEGMVDQLKRLQAEFENFKKRVARERAEEKEKARIEFIRELLPFLDDFEAALKASKGSKDKEMKKGMRMLYEKFFKILGIKKIKCGEKFDPFTQEAVGTEEGEEGKILRIEREGYELNGKVIRYAQVIVGKKKEV